jgi:hypothetical protein
LLPRSVCEEKLHGGAITVSAFAFSGPEKPNNDSMSAATIAIENFLIFPSLRKIYIDIKTI